MSSPDAPDYDAIEARANAATEGPWLTDAGVEGDGWVFVGNRSDGREFGLWEIVHSSSDPLRDLTPEAARRELADAAFIAHARADVTALIARCRELEAKVAATQAVVTTVAELDALPKMSGIVVNGILLQRGGDGAWFETGDAAGYTSSEIDLPATVLYRPAD